MADDGREHANRNTSLTRKKSIDAEVWPEGSLEVLSQFEVDQLKNSGENGLYPLLRRCMLAVLNSGADTDDARQLFQQYRDFRVGFIQHDKIGGQQLTAVHGIVQLVAQDFRGSHNDGGIRVFFAIAG